MYETMLQVCYPCLRRLGVMWVTDNAEPLQEHFASSLVRRKLIAATEQLCAATKKDVTFLLMLPPDEWHELGLLFADYLIRYHGGKTIYLGQNVPFEQVPDVLKSSRVTHVFTMFTTPVPVGAVAGLRKKMCLPRDVPLLVAGNPSVISYLRSEKKIFVLNEPSDLLRFII